MSFTIVSTELRILFTGRDRSGASQHHKHIQFIPADDGPPIERLARGVRLDSDGTIITVFVNYPHRDVC